MVVSDAKAGDGGEGDDDIDGNTWSGPGKDVNDNEAKNVPVWTLGTWHPRLQGNSANRRKINTPGR